MNNMWQEIVVYVILGLVAIYEVFQLAQVFPMFGVKPKANKLKKCNKDACSACG